MSPPPLRIAFVVQGEGRGHLSQCLSLREMLEEGGHQVVKLLVGGGERRPIPPYFERGMQMQGVRFPSPITVPGADRTGVSLSRTVGYNLRRLGRYRQALGLIRRELAEAAPDLVVNFYDPLGGMAVKGMGKAAPPLVSLGHQYLLGHPGAPRPPFQPQGLIPFHLINRFSAPPGSLRLALSFRPLPDGPGPDTRVVPPLLRRAVLEAQPEAGRHLLVYVLNDGLGDIIMRWHEKNRDVLIHGFWDRQGAPEVEEVHPNLVFHRLSDTLFLEMMRTCRGFVGTAGFESVAEALWLGKPVMVVPTRNQVEQGWNAREAEAAGAGIAASHFDLTPFLDYLPAHRDVSERYRTWVREGHQRVLSLIQEQAARGVACSTPGGEES
jgi:uncharacterized protein (TIGR00661 family)